MSYKLTGYFLLITSLAWIVINAKFYYDYNFTSRLFLVMVPDWILGLNIIFGIFGSIVGVGILKQRIKPIISTISILIIYFLLWALEFYYLM